MQLSSIIILIDLSAWNVSFTKSLLWKIYIIKFELS